MHDALTDSGATQQPAAPGKRPLVRRRGWDWYALPAFVAAFPLGATVLWFADAGWPLSCSLQVGVLWLMLHFLTPRRSDYHAAVRGELGLHPLLWWLSVYLAVALAGMAAYALGRPARAPHEVGRPEVALLAGEVLWAGVSLVVVWRLDRRRRR